MPHASESASPVLSLVWHGKNCVRSIEDTLKSIRALSGIEFEVIVEDGGSIDGTLDVLRQAASGDPRIKVTSRPQSSSRERLLEGLRRSRGEIISICADDGILLPDTLVAALGQLRQARDAAALVCGVGGETLDVVTLFFSRYRPSLANAMLRRRALVDLGLERNGDWQVDCLELDIWQRVGGNYDWLHFAEPIATSQMGSVPGLESTSEARRHLEAGRDIIEGLFADTGFFAGATDGHYLKLECIANLHSLAREQCRGLDEAAVTRLFRPLWRRLAQEMSWLDYGSSSFARRSRTRIETFRRPAVPAPAAPTDSLDRLLRRIGIHVKAIAPPDANELALAAPLRSADELPLARLRPQLADVYGVAAGIYEERALPHESVKMSTLAEPLHDIWIDSVALATLGKISCVPTEEVKRAHSSWVDRHVSERRLAKLVLARPYDGKRRIRVGYHCSFMDSDTIRYVFKKVIAAHDRNAYEIFGYSPARDLPDDIAAAFDVVRETRSSMDDPTTIRALHMWTVSDDRFMQMVRADQIDILVELSGYSPGHRLAAMARRCAPIQVMHMNHPFTSGVPNIDYYMTDAITSPVGVSDFHTEELVRLPRSLVCFDYRDSKSPPIVDPPCLERGYITFACFGNGTKYNSELFELWAEVLRRVPNSLLRLQNNQLKKADVRRHVVARFKRLGIEPEQIIAMPGVDRGALLSVYGEVDISLDTWPWGGGLTAAESLWQGVPVVGLYGNNLRSRYSASLLKDAGCWEFVGKTPKEYVDIAARLAADPERLRTLRHRLRNMCTEHGINNSAGMARSLEDAYREMIERQTESDRSSCSSAGRAG